jgi:hypothetical protein
MRRESVGYLDVFLDRPRCRAQDAAERIDRIRRRGLDRAHQWHGLRLRQLRRRLMRLRLCVVCRQLHYTFARPLGYRVQIRLTPTPVRCA